MSSGGAGDVGASGVHARVAWVLSQHDEHVAKVEADRLDTQLHLAVGNCSAECRLLADLQVRHGTHKRQLESDRAGDGRRLRDEPADLACLTPHQHLRFGGCAKLQSPHGTAFIPKLAGADGLCKACSS